MNLASLMFPQRRRSGIKLSMIPFGENEYRHVGEVYDGESLQQEFRHPRAFDHGQKVMLGFSGHCLVANATALGFLRDAYRAQRPWKIDMPFRKWPIRMPFILTEFEQGQHDEAALVWIELWGSSQHWPATHTGPKVNIGTNGIVKA